MAAALLVLPGQAALAMDPSAQELEGSVSGPNVALDQATVTQLLDQVDVLNALNTVLSDENLVLVDANGTLTADNSNLMQAIDRITRERDRLQASLSHFDGLYDPLEADRQLLFELRKGLPESRPEAEAQLERMRRLALSSNPAGLGQLVDRVAETAPAFLEWRFTQFGSPQEASSAYINTGANAFESNMDDFRSAVLLSVANRIDGLLTVLDGVR
ncbi:MAG: hypothetical protein ACC726_16880 [Chloroflexota bacterium]